MKAKNEKDKKHSALYYLKRDKWLYLLTLLPIIHFILFKYLPMFGIVIAFQDYNMFKGVFGSEFVGLKMFKKVFRSMSFWPSVRNTLVLNLLGLLVSYPLVIILSLMLNEIRCLKFKKVAQSILYLPHFISWVVIAGLVENLFSMSHGTINHLLQGIGIGPIPFLSENGWWIFTYLLTGLWKGIGWSTIIYLAALAGVDESLYEAAYLDGATRFQRIIYVTLPLIKPIMVTQLLLSLSSMLSIGLDAPLLLGNGKVSEVSSVISTYVYSMGIAQAKYPEATAIGLSQSVVNILILFIADRFAKWIGEEGIL